MTASPKRASSVSRSMRAALGQQPPAQDHSKQDTQALVQPEAPSTELHDAAVAPQGSSPAVKATSAANKWTVLLSDEEQLVWDELALLLRKATGRRVKKSDYVRSLVQLASTNPVVQDAVITALRHDG